MRITPVELNTDVALLWLVVQNLFDNAVSYTDPGGHIEISAGVTQGVATLSVRNSASKLPSDLERRVFDRFWRASASRSASKQRASWKGVSR